MKYFLFTLCFIGLVSCSTAEKNSGTAEVPGPTEAEQQDYRRVVEKFTSQAQLYSGLMNISQLHATLLNEEIQSRQLQLKAKTYGWSEDHLRAERNLILKKNQNETQAFVSFYTGEVSHDDLDQTQSVWRLFLEVGNTRYQGKVQKLRVPLPEVSELYPYHNRWHTPYVVTFDVPQANVQNQSTQLIIQGPLGAQVLKFQPLQYGSSTQPQEAE